MLALKQPVGTAELQNAEQNDVDKATPQAAHLPPKGQKQDEMKKSEKWQGVLGTICHLFSLNVILFLHTPHPDALPFPPIRRELFCGHSLSASSQYAL